MTVRETTNLNMLNFFRIFFFFNVNGIIWNEILKLKMIKFSGQIDMKF